MTTTPKQNHLAVQTAQPPQTNFGNFMPPTQVWTQICQLASAAFTSGLLPGSIRNKEAAAIVALKAWELGIPMMQGYSSLFVLNGKVGMESNLMRQLAARNLRGLSIEFVTTNAKICTLLFSAPNKKPLQVSYTIEEAHVAGLLKKDNWVKFPADMLYNRALGRGLRRFCPETLGTVYTEEELKDHTAIDVESRPLESKAEVEPSSSPEQENAIEVEPSTPPRAEGVTANPTLGNEDLEYLRELVKTNGWTNQEVNATMRQSFGAGKLSELTRTQFEELCLTIQSKRTETPFSWPETPPTIVRPHATPKIEPRALSEEEELWDPSDDSKI